MNQIGGIFRRNKAGFHLCFAAEGNQFVIEAFHVQETTGLLVFLESRPGQHFKKFIKRPNPTWESNKGIAKLSHARFSFEHGFDHIHAGRLGVSQFAFLQVSRDHPNHFATGIKAAVRNRAHEAETSAAGDKPNPVLSEVFPNDPSRLRESRVGPAVGTAEDADRSHLGGH